MRVLAVASSGGHWVQLMRLRPAWEGCDIAYLTTDASYLAPLQAQAERDGVPPPRFYVTVAANRWQKLRLLRQLAGIAWVLARDVDLRRSMGKTEPIRRGAPHSGAPQGWWP